MLCTLLRAPGELFLIAIPGSDTESGETALKGWRSPLQRSRALPRCVAEVEAQSLLMVPTEGEVCMCRSSLEGHREPRNHYMAVWGLPCWVYSARPGRFLRIIHAGEQTKRFPPWALGWGRALGAERTGHCVLCQRMWPRGSQWGCCARPLQTQ